jgi:putative component of membrane protein insertase Oxa1/YidC/SpoIIIJ protein YidD
MQGLQLSVVSCQLSSEVLLHVYQSYLSAHILHRCQLSAEVLPTCILATCQLRSSTVQNPHIPPSCQLSSEVLLHVYQIYLSAHILNRCQLGAEVLPHLYPSYLSAQVLYSPHTPPSCKFSSTLRRPEAKLRLHSTSTLRV